ncbi:MAG: ABC transporter permease [Candidatus Hodarchaeota archaeon]
MIIPVIQNLLSSTLRMSTVLVFPALGGIASEVVGVLNIALEGKMLIGSFVAVAVSYYTGSSLTAVLAAMFVGGILGWLLVASHLRFRADPIVIGLAINILAMGITIFLLKSFFGVRGALASPQIVGIPQAPFGKLSQISFVGPLLFGQTLLVYVAVLGVPALHLVLYGTKFGLRARGVGENTSGAKALGINIDGVRYLWVSMTGVLAALGGAYLALGQLNMFVENMTNGRGYIALAAVIVGRGRPWRTFAACLIFGFAESIQINLQLLRLPNQFVQMIPYLATILILIGVAIRRRGVAR